MGTLIRDAVAADFSAIRQIAEEGWARTYSHLPAEKLVELVNEYYSGKNLEDIISSEESKGRLIVAEKDGRVIGFCQVNAEKDDGEMVKLYVEHASSLQGIGTKLMQRGEEILRKSRCSGCFAYVNMHNKRGVGFYLKNGFRHEKRNDKRDEFSEENILWCMKKKL